MKNITAFYDRWAAGTAGRKTREGHYRIGIDGTTFEYHGKGRKVEEGVDILARKLKDGMILCNASRFDRCGSFMRGTMSPLQYHMDKAGHVMLPFSVFAEAKLDIRKIRMVERAGNEELEVAKREWVEYKKEYQMVDPWSTATLAADPRLDPTKIVVYCEEGEQREHVTDKDGNDVTRKLPDGGEEYVYKTVKVWRARYCDRGMLETRHFIGAMLLRIGSRHFLFDVDRNEVRHYRFNPFLVELAGQPKTITEAYASLKPEAVIKAEKAGVAVVRQGEWFFIETDREISDTDPVFAKDSKNYMRLEKACPSVIKYGLSTEFMPDYRMGRNAGDVKYNSERVIDGLKECTGQVRGYVLSKYRKRVIAACRQYAAAVASHAKELGAYIEKSENNRFFSYGGSLQAGGNRPNVVSKLAKIKGVSYVRGTVTHSGREHEPIELKKWCLAVPNTSVKSWTIRGDVD